MLKQAVEVSWDLRVSDRAELRLTVLAELGDLSLAELELCMAWCKTCHILLGI